MPIPYKCPVCDGAGKVSRPPWVPGDVFTWSGTTDASPYRCYPCMGGGIIWGPDRIEWESNDEQLVPHGR